MTSAVTPFLFEGEHLVRTMPRDGAPWFVAMDICRALDLANSRDAIARLDEDEKGVGISDTLGGRQDMPSKLRACFPDMPPILGACFREIHPNWDTFFRLWLKGAGIFGSGEPRHD